MTAAWPADKVERWKIERLAPYARNSRTHSADQIKQIAASIGEWGWTVPVLVDETGQIIAGHARVQAAKLLGLTEVPVMMASGWSEDQKRAYVIADNQLAVNAGWDKALLLQEIGELEAANFNIELLAFTQAEILALQGGCAARWQR